MKIEANQLEHVVKIVAHKLQGESYAFRGTASLFLQGLDMNVDDIDLLCDAKTALDANSKLSDYLVEEVSFKESPKFKSYYGKFIIDKVQVEVMGDWQIFSEKKGWSKVYNADAENITHVTLDGIEIPVTKIGLELEVFAQMGRWTAYQKIKRLIEERCQISLEQESRKPRNPSNQQKLF
jgi:hypothetical protein